MPMTHPAPPRRSAEEQARLDAELRLLCEQRITFNQTLGLRIESLDPATGPCVSFEMRPELVGHYLFGRLHGGVISAVLDATAGFALMVAQGEKHPHETTEQIMARFARIGTIDLRIDYLRPGIGARFHASCQVLRLGGRIGSTQMRLENDAGELIATGAGAYMIS
jgi:uncharacterized protein (TIGR00369 family)